jgi:class 3 adenylate cyclase
LSSNISTRTDPEVAEAVTGEWRSLTVMFCDLVGSTAILQRLGEEAFWELLRDYYALCTTIVRRHGGQVSQYQGDGVICQFGFPRSAEDDASRAVAAALAVVAEMPAIAVPGGGSPLQVRVGLATGRVRLERERDFGSGAVGACVNRAARLQTLAPPGGVLVCAVTRRLSGDLFQYADQRTATLGGFDVPEPVHRVLRRVRAPITRFEARRGGREAPIVGRDAEIALLRTRLAEAEAGRGSSILIAAPAGFGKSMLAHALLSGPDAERRRTIILQCARERRDSALHPVREMVAWVAGAQPGEPAATRHEKIRRLLSVVWGAEGPALEGLLDLLSPFGAGEGAGSDASGGLRRRLALEALVRQFFKAGAGKDVLVLVVEDLHWADPSTLDLLRGLAAAAPGERALVIATSRPEAGAEAAGLGETMTLQPLTQEDGARLARSLGGRLPESTLKTVVDRSEGVPLFLLEFVRAAQDGDGAERGSAALSGVPLTLDILIQSRLDDLDPDARRLARFAAALGPRFDPARAIATAGLDSQAATLALEALREARLATEAGGTGAGTMAFSHALVRDAIYTGLDAGARRAIHSRIADEMLADPDAAVQGMETVAEHLALAGRQAEAGEAFLAAAGAAARSGSMAEAAAHLERALRALEDISAGDARDRLELGVRAMEGPVHMVMRGPGSPEFGAAQDRALGLMRRLGMGGGSHVVYNCALHAWARADLDAADRIAAEIGDEGDDNRGLLARSTMQGLVAWHRGDNAEAAARMGAVSERYDPALHIGLYPVFLKDFGVFARFYRALALTVLGETEAGEREAEAALALARELRLPHAIGFALLARFNVAMLRGETETAAARAAEAEAYALHQSFPEFAAMATHCLGWADCRGGRTAEGLARMEDGAARWAGTGFRTWQPLFAAERAACLVQAGETARAEATIIEAEAAVALSGEYQAAAPIGLARALLRAAEGRPSAARAEALAAREIADRQGAVLWRDRIDAALAALPPDERRTP